VESGLPAPYANSPNRVVTPFPGGIANRAAIPRTLLKSAGCTFLAWAAATGVDVGTEPRATLPGVGPGAGSLGKRLLGQHALFQALLGKLHAQAQAALQLPARDVPGCAKADDVRVVESSHRAVARPGVWLRFPRMRVPS